MCDQLLLMCVIHLTLVLLNIYSANKLFSRVLQNSITVVVEISDINFISPSDCRMAFEHLQFIIRVLCLKDVGLSTTVNNIVFKDWNHFTFVSKIIIGYDEFWQLLLFAMIQALYPVYHILSLFGDMKMGGMDKLKFYVLHTD